MQSAFYSGSVFATAFSSFFLEHHSSSQVKCKKHKENEMDVDVVKFDEML